MNGHNELNLNHATMLAAVEYWLNQTQLKEPVNVKDVTFNGGNRTFCVEFEPVVPVSAADTGAAK